MKKKIACIVFAVFVIPVLFGCSSTTNTNATSEQSMEEITTTTTATTTTVATTTTKAVSESDLDISEYLLERESFTGTSTWYFLVVKNNSTSIIRLSYNAVARDADDKAIGAADGFPIVLGPGGEAITFTFFEDVTGVDHVSRTLTLEETDKFRPEISNLEAEASINKSNVVVTITNNGEKAAKNFYVDVLFYDKDGKFVDCSSEKIDELLPGASTAKQIEAYVKYDSVKILFSDAQW